MARIYAKDGVRGTLIDLITRKPIRVPVWFDQETGEYEAFRLDAVGKILHENGKPVRYRGKTKLQFIPSYTDNQKFIEKVAPDKFVGTPKSVIPITKREKLYPLLQLRCEAYGCDRIAAWSVSDEVPSSPVVQGNRKYETGITIARRYYCSWHYQPPRLLDAKGDVISVDEDACGVRPQ